jgi:hypothetical protein
MSAHFTRLYLAILPLIAQGRGTVYSLAEALPDLHISAVRAAVANLVKTHGLIRSVRKARSGVPALYELTCPLGEALERVDFRPAAKPTCVALDAALGTPDSIAAMLATRVKPKIVQRMGKWDAPMGRPKKAARAAA